MDDSRLQTVTALADEIGEIMEDLAPAALRASVERTKQHRLAETLQQAGQDIVALARAIEVLTRRLEAET